MTTRYLRSCVLYRLLVPGILLLYCLSSNAQPQHREEQRTISLHHSSIKLSEVFKAITRQTGYTFFYNGAVVKDQEVVAVNFDNATIAHVLDELLKPKGYIWEIHNNQIGIFLKPAPAKSTGVNDTTSLITLTGIVTTSDGTPLAGATVLVKGSKVGTATDAAGRFRMNGVRPDATVEVRYTGYESQEIKLKGKTEIAAKLGLEVREIAGVSVVSTGYQTIPKERATGSFSRIDNELINREVSTDIVSRLKGIAPSLLFDERGGQTKLYIRGRSTIFANDQPLIVIDNFPYDGDIRNINPNDIDNITLLKDAAAASIWGVKAGNGVIVITTKKGSRNQPTRVELNSNITIGRSQMCFISQRCQRVISLM